MTKEQIELGRFGEKKAVAFLKKNGYRIVEKNYKCRLGEIDIIAIDKNTLVFVEVKSRTQSNFGEPQESVNYQKIRHISNVALNYIQKKKLEDVNIRFDVVGVSFGDNKKPHIELIKDAFHPSEILNNWPF